MLTVFDAIVRHQLYVEGLKAGQTQRLNEVMRQVDQDLRNVLAVWRYDELGRMSKAKLQELVRSLREVMRTSLDPYVEEMVRFFEFYMREDRTTLMDVFGEFTDVRDGMVPTEDKLWPIVWGAPMAANGILAAVFLKQAASSAVIRVERAAVRAYANNMTRAELSAAIAGTRTRQFRDGELNRIFRASNAVNNTVIQHIAAQTNFNVAKALFPEYEWVSILDDATTNICRSRDGKRWRYGAGPIPPAHVGCRSSIMPVVEGQPQPPGTFDAWFRAQPDEVQADLAGYHRSPKPLTLEQFKAKRSLILTP